jgi:signal transduction histidine kinase
MNKEKQRQILELQTKYETATKEKENELLKKQKKIQQATIQNEVTKNRAYSIIAVLAILLLSGVVGLYFYRHKTSKRISRQNAELEKLNNELNEKNESLEEMNETKDKLFSIISHDLKNQFSIIMSYSEMLSEDINELNQEEIQNFTGGIYESSESVLKSLENMLNWARSQLNKISVNPIPFSLNEVINEVSMIYSKFAESKRIELTVNTPEELYAYADKNMIDSVIKNLVSNACKFTEPETGRVSIKAVRSYNFCRVTIEDNGVGMDQNTINNLFKLKQNATERGTKNEKGTGLGLILTKEFIEKNGGELTVKSELNEGSAFTFTVPLYPDPIS